MNKITNDMETQIKLILLLLKDNSPLNEFTHKNIENGTLMLFERLKDKIHELEYKKDLLEYDNY